MRIELVIAADEPALFFSSVRAAELALEWIDVRDGVYTAIYGREGEIYKISEDGREVHIERDVRQPPRPDELRALLLFCLARRQKPGGAEESLEALLRRCEPYCRE